MCFYFEKVSLFSPITFIGRAILAMHLIVPKITAPPAKSPRYSDMAYLSFKDKPPVSYVIPFPEEKQTQNYDMIKL